MAQKMTPPYGIAGYWELKAPFVAKPGKVYSCHEIRSFSMLKLQGFNVYDLYYLPHDLKESDEERDSKAFASIVTLLAEDGERIHVPDTYISKYPIIDGKGYNRFILSCDLGTLPANSQVNHIADKVKAEVFKVFGRQPVVAIHIAPIMKDNLTPTEREREEANRKAGIIDSRTTYGQLQAISVNYGNLQAYVKVLEKQLQDGNKVLTDNAKLLDAQVKERDREIEKLNLQIKGLTADLEAGNKLTRSQAQRIRILEEKIRENGLTVPE